MSQLTLLYIPVPDQDTGRTLTQRALTDKLAACGNLIGPIESIYEWEGEVRQDTEWVLILKTTAEQAVACTHRIEEEHPYDCPAIIRLPASANAAFAHWVSGQTR